MCLMSGVRQRTLQYRTSRAVTSSRLIGTGRLFHRLIIADKLWRGLREDSETYDAFYITLYAVHSTHGLASMVRRTIVFSARLTNAGPNTGVVSVCPTVSVDTPSFNPVRLYSVAIVIHAYMIHNIEIYFTSHDRAMFLVSWDQSSISWSWLVSLGVHPERVC